MFYFTCNESKINESFTFWNKLQEKTFSRHSNLLRCTCISLGKKRNIVLEKEGQKFKKHSFKGTVHP